MSFFRWRIWTLNHPTDNYQNLILKTSLAVSKDQAFLTDLGRLAYFAGIPGLQWRRGGDGTTSIQKVLTSSCCSPVSSLWPTWFCRCEGWLNPKINNHHKFYCDQGEGTPFIMWTVPRSHCLSLIRLMNQLASLLKWFLLFPLLNNSTTGFERERGENSPGKKENPSS